jgi:hypothetical protein
VTDLAKLVVRLEAEIGKYQDNLDKAEKRLARFDGSAKKMLGNLAGAFATFFTVDRLQAWGSRILENADHVGKLAERAGVGVEAMSKLQYAFETGNVSGESLTTMLRKLNQNLSEAAGKADSEAGRAFRALGIEVTDATGKIRAADDVLFDLADRFSGYSDGANKSAIATKLLGRAGEEAIPVLNGGAEGLRNLGDEAARVGRVISEDLAKKADEFNDRLDRLRSTLIDGIGNRIAADLLPNLNALGEELERTADKSLALERGSEALATVVRTLVDLGLGASTAFVKLGNAIGGVGAAAVAAAQLDFERAGQIIEDVTADNLAIEEDYQKQRAALWKEGGEQILEEVQITVKKLKAEAPNLAGGKELEDATKKAIDKLRDMATQLQQQVGTFGASESAVLAYRLEMGDLAETLKAAGTEGEALAQKIIGQAEALERLKNAKDVGEALAEVNVQIQQLQGNSAEAALLEFDRKNAELVTKLRQQGNEEGLRQLETLTMLITAQADFNALTEKAASIQAELGRNEDRIRNSREAGAISELDMQEQLGDAREKAASDLAAINAEMLKIAEQSGNPALIENAKQLGAEIENLKAQSHLLGDAIRNDFEDAFSSSLKTVIKDFRNAGDAAAAFFDSIADMLLDLAIQQLTANLTSSFATAGGGGSGGNWFNTIAGLFAGGKASGGPVTGGMAYKINESTPNSEYFIPGKSGRVVPASELASGQKVEQHFHIQAPQGTVSRQTQMQIGAQAAKSLASANRRNN